jgi:eukaryotic-like serine/threonine-protein kinase
MVSEAAYRSVPSSVGPYTVVARPDLEVPGVALPEERFVARSRDGARTVLVCVPRPGADAGRFVAEAEGSRYLLGRWVSPATEVSEPGRLPWHARPYVPALPLPSALAVYGGPLPEHTVRALGACLAEALGVAHGQGLAHAGVSPGAVLLACDGPRLGCFGAVRAAAPDGEPRSGRPGLDAGSLPPEQGSGGRPQPFGDVYGLGATLAYAATGHTAPDRQQLPAFLRELVTACMARDPAARPRVAELTAALAEPAPPPGTSRTGHGTSRTGQVAGVKSAPSAGEEAAPDAREGFVPAPGWLPGRLVAAVARQSADVLAAEIDATETAPPVPAVSEPSRGAATPPPAPAADADAGTDAEGQLPSATGGFTGASSTTGGFTRASPPPRSARPLGRHRPE